MPNPFNLNNMFYDSCLNNSGQFRNQSQISSTSTLVSSITYIFGKLKVKGIVVSDSFYLTDHYSAAYKDFFSMCSGTLCIYKSGSVRPEWEKTLFCPLLMWISMKHKTLPFDAVVAATDDIKLILSLASFSDIEVDFCKLEVTNSIAGSKLLSFNLLLDLMSEFHKPFMLMLGLSIVPPKMLHYKGTSALYFCLSNNDECVVFLTAAYITHPPAVYTYTGMSHLHPRQLGEFVKGKNAVVINLCKYTQYEVEKATRMINDLNKLHDEITKCRTNLNLCIISFILHAEPIVVISRPTEFTHDWAFIQIYHKKIDWSTFSKNNIYISGNLSPSDFGKFLFLQLKDQAGYEYLDDRLLQASGIMKDNEIHQLQHLNIHSEKAFLVVKNSLTIGTIISCANRLESFTYSYAIYSTKYISIEVAILSYTDNGKLCGPFSALRDLF
ncbi:uncharacterized protein BT62DRAFT_922688 [Guyanagaster necrorhizus]|uniref:Uncharacterized protein n=1 Tax=Guyanagaster necrorhizus TaxID=856835 RepID=A0A9P7VK92_9AGAR|nr:uncharacterized protein BT62DRAFT_922688 [Guyanagaster necrorhizus MCA 3950]KAG7442254.1 hypothetical protein BT62DRAFT_922688 [Guyanagaster necrorhizus MCA 3950]